MESIVLLQDILYKIILSLYIDQYNHFQDSLLEHHRVDNEHYLSRQNIFLH